MTKCPSEDCHNNVKNIQETVKNLVNTIFLKNGGVAFMKKPSWLVISFTIVVLVVPFITTMSDLVWGQKENEYKYADKNEVIENTTQIKLMQLQLEQLAITQEEIKRKADKNKEEIKEEIIDQVGGIKELIKAMHSTPYDGH